MTITITAATQIPIWRRTIECPPEMIQKAIQGEKASKSLSAPIGSFPQRPAVLRVGCTYEPHMCLRSSVFSSYVMLNQGATKMNSWWAKESDPFSGDSHVREGSPRGGRTD